VTYNKLVDGDSDVINRWQHGSLAQQLYQQNVLDILIIVLMLLKCEERNS